nr:hypothetical protein [Tanacetum cinerariifolium]
DKKTGKGGDEVRESEGKSDKEETRQEEEENFDPIPRTPKESEEESNDEEEQDLRLSEEARIQEEEDVDELYRDVNINQGRGLQMEGNKSIQQSDEQRNLYKALVEAYEADKAILDTYGDSTILKRRREDDDQEGPSTGPNRGSKRQKEGGEQASASTPSEKATPVRWKKPHIQCLRQVPMINQL